LKVDVFITTSSVVFSVGNASVKGEKTINQNSNIA